MKLKNLIASLERGTIGIYKIVSPSGRVYIGQSRCLKSRFSNYRSQDTRYQPILGNSFKKYGVFKHTFEVLEICVFEDLNLKERYWQDFYDVCNKSKGLNCILVATDEKVAEVSKETREKISKSLSGRTRSKEIRKNMREASTQKIPVFQYSVEGELITRHASIKEAAEIYKVNSAHITSCCKGKVRTVRGFIWSYSICHIIPVRLKEVPVEQYTLDGILLTTYKNITTASKSTNIKPSAISNNLRNKSRTSGGFVFKFYKNTPTSQNN